MEIVLLCHKQAVAATTRIDVVLNIHKGKIPGLIFLKSNLYEFLCHCASLNLTDEEVSTGATQCIRRGTYDELITDAQRQKIIDECVAAIIECRDAYKVTSDPHTDSKASRFIGV